MDGTSLDQLEIPMEDFLEHFGVRGMKWGVRRAEKKAAKADAKWQKNIYSVRGGVAIHNKVADKMNNGGLDRLNSNPRFKNNKFDDYFNPLNKSARDYIAEYNKMTEQFTKEAVAEVHGTSPSGKLKASLGELDGHTAVIIEKVDISHADVEFETLKIILDTDERGIIGASMVEDELAQSVINISMEDFLEHFGVRGMKWGVRKRVTNKVASKRDRSPQAKARKLSDEDLKKAVERLDMEKRYVQVTKQLKDPNPVKGVLAKHGSQMASIAVGAITTTLIKSAIEKKLGN